ncbi:MAG: chemotaxis protein CheC, partial [candidate division NC10 bacterium]|nr:chemotaxis protein CheC [candidate division NC10 bacterium]
GMGHATSALSQLLGHPLSLTVPRVSILPLEEIPGHIGGKEEVVAGLYLRVRGDARGNILILLPRRSVTSVLWMLTGNETGGGLGLSEEERSVLRELGNILASAYLIALSKQLGVPLIPSIPGLAFDMAGAVVDYLLIELAAAGREAMIIETNFMSPENEVSGRLFLFLDSPSIAAYLRLHPTTLPGTQEG